jgi:hypothetical protein
MSTEVKKTDKATMNDKDMQAVTLTTGQQLAAQEKVKVKLYLAPEERQKLESVEAAGKNAVWPYETVQINGYTYQIQKGKEVEVPESVAEVLRQANII